MKEWQDILREWKQHRSESMALATLVRATGSSYRRPGARMLVSGDGKMVGGLSGGCLEEEVAESSAEVIASTCPKLMSFDTRRRFGCDGRIDVLIELVRNDLFAEVAAQTMARQSCTACTDFDLQGEKVGTRLLNCGEPEEEQTLIQIITPPLRLIIVGHGPENTALCAIASVLGWEVVEVEHEFQIPFSFDDWTEVIVKTHNYGRDFATLQSLLPRGLRYLGLVSSRTRREQLLADLFDSQPIGDLFAPAGLDLAADTPEQIALAIAAEIHCVFAEGTGQRLRDRKTPIHRRQSRALSCERLVQ